MLSTSCIFIAILLSHSFSNLSLITLLWSLDPSLPARGLSFIPNVTVIVGGSIGCEGIVLFTDKSDKVSETFALDMPAIETISPASASSIGCCFRPLKARILLTLKFSILFPFISNALSI